MTTLPALRAPLPVLVDELLSLTAKLHPDEALERLAPLWAASKPGIAQRALLAARVALMRQAMLAVPPVAEILPPPLEPEPEPAPVFMPAPPPKPLKAGALTLLNLDDVAKMLMAGSDDEGENEDVTAGPPVAAPAAAASDKAVSDVTRAGAEAELADAIAAEATKAGKAKARRAATPSPKPAAPLDLAAQFADMAEDGPAKPAPLDLAAQFAEMGDALPAAAAKPARKAKSTGLSVDLSAQFAAMDGD